MELSNCERCGEVFAKNVRDICPKCFQEEEEAFKIVYRFLTKRKNREATLAEIVEATGVEEELIVKFIKENRLRTSQFPKLAYPCEQCGVDIVEGKLCHACSTHIKSEYSRHEQMQRAMEERKKKDHEPVYYTMQKEKRDKK